MDREIENGGNIYANKKTENSKDYRGVQFPNEAKTNSVSNDNIQQNSQNVNNGPEILDKMPTEKKSTIKSLKKGIDTFRKEIRMIKSFFFSRNN